MISWSILVALRSPAKTATFNLLLSSSWITVLLWLYYANDPKWIMNDSFKKWLLFKGLNAWSCLNTCLPGTSLATCVRRCPWCYSHITGADSNQLLRCMVKDGTSPTWQRMLPAVLGLVKRNARAGFGLSSLGKALCNAVAFGLGPKPIDRKSQTPVNETRLVARSALMQMLLQASDQVQ